MTAANVIGDRTLSIAIEFMNIENVTRLVLAVVDQAGIINVVIIDVVSYHFLR